MSDMPLPSPLPAPDHARHDGSLVAQHAAGDALGEDQQHEAQRLLATCSACAQLALDLRTLAAAVAREPVPPRRRDFRLDTVQAERLRGNAVSRFLRRLSLPQSRALGPAAAGLFSVGLVFVVAGYAWPGDGGVIVRTEPDAPPAAVELVTASPSLEEIVPPASRDEIVPPASRDDGVSEDVLSGEPETEAETEAEAFMAEAPSERLADGLAATEQADKEMAAASGPTDLAGEAPLQSADDSLELAAPTGADTMAGADTVAGADTLAGTDVDSSTSSPAGEARAPVDAWLIVTGLGLAVVGGLLAMLAWLARRVADPLLR
jgi:hypothetical protein